MKERADNINYFGGAELFKAYACKRYRYNSFHYRHCLHNFTAIFGKSKSYLGLGHYHCSGDNSLQLHTKAGVFDESNG